MNELVYSYAWTGDGKRLAVAGEKTLLILDGNSPSQVDASYSLEDIGRVASLDWSSDGKYLAFTQGMNAKSDWGVFQFDQESLQLIQFDGIDSLPNAVSWHPTKPILAVGLGQVGRDGSPVQLWDVNDQQLLLTIPTNELKVQDLEFSNEGDRLAVAFDRPVGLVAFESSG
ncbi:MAG: WD40 repeat domain-containing protein, partial [Planctomycetaceae bacterium]|nr:WD40 repeat domain-containing protein [Planctomycetaceae bacterium]